METKKKAVLEIRHMAELLEPYTKINLSTHNTDEASKLIPVETAEYIAVVRAWWCSLLAMAELVSTQKEDIRGLQKDYILRELCGGMGSFADLQLDASISGNKVDKTNQELSKARERLYNILA
jgi:hypothetical protein